MASPFHKPLRGGRVGPRRTSTRAPGLAPAPPRGPGWPQQPRDEQIISVLSRGSDRMKDPHPSGVLGKLENHDLPYPLEGNSNETACQAVKKFWSPHLSKGNLTPAYIKGKPESDGRSRVSPFKGQPKSQFKQCSSYPPPSQGSLKLWLFAKAFEG